MNKKNTLFVMIIILLIIASPLWLWLGNSGFNYDYGKEVEMTFSYIGSVIGGIATLIALYITVKQTRGIQERNNEQIVINNINEKIKDCTDLYDAINEGNSILSELYLNYANKTKWMTEQIQGVLKEVNKVDNQILKIDTNPLILTMGCNTDILKEQYDKILKSITGKIVITDTKEIQEEIKKLISDFDEASEKIKQYITALYEKKYAKLDI